MYFCQLETPNVSCTETYLFFHYSCISWHSSGDFPPEIWDLESPPDSTFEASNRQRLALPDIDEV